MVPGDQANKQTNQRSIETKIKDYLSSMAGEISEPQFAEYASAYPVSAVNIQINLLSAILLCDNLL